MFTVVAKNQTEQDFLDQIVELIDFTGCLTYSEQDFINNNVAQSFTCFYANYSDEAIRVSEYARMIQEIINEAVKQNVFCAGTLSAYRCCSESGTVLTDETPDPPTLIYAAKISFGIK